MKNIKLACFPKLSVQHSPLTTHPFSTFQVGSTEKKQTTNVTIHPYCNGLLHSTELETGSQLGNSSGVLTMSKDKQEGYEAYQDML